MRIRVWRCTISDKTATSYKWVIISEPFKIYGERHLTGHVIKKVVCNKVTIETPDGAVSPIGMNYNTIIQLCFDYMPSPDRIRRSRFTIEAYERSYGPEPLGLYAMLRNHFYPAPNCHTKF